MAAHELGKPRSNGASCRSIAPSAASLDRELLRDQLRLVVWQTVPAAFWGVGCVFLYFGVQRLFRLPEQGDVVALFLTMALVLGALGTLVHRSTKRPRWAHPLAALLVLLALAAETSLMVRFDASLRTVNLLLMTVGVGFLFLELGWLIGVLAAIQLSWLTVVWRAEFAEAWWQYRFSFITATVLCLLMHAIRRRTLLRLFRLDQLHQAQRLQLQKLLATLEAEIDVRSRQQRVIENALATHEHERRVTAYELHDGLVQYVTAAKMHLEAYQNRAASSEQPNRRDLEVAEAHLQQAIDEARRMIRGLRPPALEQAGLIDALALLIDEQNARAAADVSIAFEHEGDWQRLGPLVELALYRIAQEALTNALRHSDSKEIRVHLAIHPDEVQLLVQDQGRGFDVSRARSQRFGLDGIRERARLIGGDVAIDSKPGSGTEIRVRLPLDAALFELSTRGNTGSQFNASGAATTQQAIVPEWQI